MSCAFNGQNPPPEEKSRGGLLARAAISRGAFMSNHALEQGNVECGREKVGNLRAGESPARIATASRQLEVRIAIKNVDIVLRRRSPGCLLAKAWWGLVARVDGSL